MADKQSSRGQRSDLAGLIAPFLQREFLRFCLVGASGVFVNLGCLWFFEQLEVVTNLASALAIQCSIGSNFILNERWTFRAGPTARWRRAIRFQLVSLFGALLQWGSFLLLNLFWAQLLWPERWGEWRAIHGWLGAISDPPQVGHWIYLSQLCGIALATGWNFLANFYWTWQRGNSVEG